MPISNILKRFFGSKSQRDIKEILPLLHKIREAYPLIEALSHDELRARTLQIKDQVRNVVKEKEAVIDTAKIIGPINMLNFTFHHLCYLLVGRLLRRSTILQLRKLHAISFANEM